MYRVTEKKGKKNLTVASIFVDCCDWRAFCFNMLANLFFFPPPELWCFRPLGRVTSANDLYGDRPIFSLCNFNKYRGAEWLFYVFQWIEFVKSEIRVFSPKKLKVKCQKENDENLRSENELELSFRKNWEFTEF